ncbi:hypothetical protein ALGA_2524 [Labilibaculum antarcticum]|uniref:Restriction endonuclease n=1 Tax=Labilibaculum antarcticum TaxID=1717717 RepID=A0A1Y1CKC7_9BACT|nr:hypothetical protein ALGA_2524 [Labilibaculum antarcticum]
MNFHEKVKKHLTTYKADKYPSMKNGIWRPKSINKELGYAFSNYREDYKFNILEKYRDQFYNSELSKIKKHIYFHHLNSSQAMCINFFYPLIVENQLHLLSEFLGFKNEKIEKKTAVFEKDSPIDSIGKYRPTNFDFYFKTESGKEFYFEIKYTEGQFGKAKNDQDHISKYEAVYKHNMQVIANEYTNKDTFFSHYQIIRNLIHVGDDKYVVFLYPKENKKINQQASKAKTNILKEAYQANLYNTYWEDIYNYISTNLKGEALKNQMIEFGEKYFVKATD